MPRQDRPKESLDPSGTGPEAHRHRVRPNLVLAVLALGALSFAMLQSMVTPALPVIQARLHTDAAGTAWVLTGYLMSASVAIPIAGRLGDIHGKKRVLTVVLAMFAAGTVLCAVAGSIEVLVAGRVVQGLAGAMFPLSFGIIRDEFPPIRVPTAIGLISAIIGVGGGIGIVLAGTIVDLLSYHWLFWIPLALIVLAGVATVLVVPESPVRAPSRIHLTGAALLSGALLSLLLGVTRGESWGWTSPRTLGLLAAAALLSVVWVAAELRARQPLVDMRVMAQPLVWRVNLAGMLLGLGLFGSWVLVPMLVQLPATHEPGMGGTTTEAGLYMLPTSAVMLVSGPFAGRLTRRYGARLPMVLGAALLAASMAFLTFAHAAPWQLLASAPVTGLGFGFVFSAMTNLVVSAVPMDQTGVATGMNAIARTVGGAIGTQVIGAVLAASATRALLPTDAGFTEAFAIAALACAGALAISLGLPRTVGPVPEPVPGAAAAATRPARISAGWSSRRPVRRPAEG